MRDYLIFRLYGAMAAWGKTAVGEMRHSDDHPTQSALMGLLAAALGIRRHEEDALQMLQKQLGVAIRVNAPGILLKDYHTTQTPPADKHCYRTRRDEVHKDNRHLLNTILSTREYYCDAWYTIVLWEKETNSTFTLLQMQKALRQPYFTLYLGRKSCPLTWPLRPQLVQDENILQALAQWDRREEESGSAAAWSNEFSKTLPPEKKNPPQRLYWDSEGHMPPLPHMQITRKDYLYHRQRWQYQDRLEYLYFIDGEKQS